MQDQERTMPGLFGKRLAMSLIGTILCAFAVGFFRCSRFGVDPFQCLAMGVWGKVGATWSYGTFYMLLSLAMLLLDLVLDRHNIGLATFINLFLTGYIVNFSVGLISDLCPEPGLTVRVIFLTIGILVMCFASSLYMTADMGVSVYDAIPIWISGHYHRQFRIVRIISDIICVTTGTICVLMGAVDGQLPGLGTVITALFMGPLVNYFNHRFSEPLLGHQRAQDAVRQ